MARSGCHRRPAKKEASYIMLHVGLDLSRKRVDVCLISDQGELVDELAAPFDEDGLCRLAERVAAKQKGRVRAVVESMNGARFVHDTLEAQGWDVLVADAQRVKGLAPLACKTDKIDARVLAEVSERELGQHARVDLVGLARQRREALDALRVSDEHVPALGLERVVQNRAPFIDSTTARTRPVCFAATRSGKRHRPSSSNGAASSSTSSP